MRKSLMLLMIISLAFGSNFSELLSSYNKKSDLSYKTRKESLGHYIIYTRQDIRRMNATTLGDLLKSLRFFTFEPSPYGNYDLIPAGFPSSTYQQTRIYINDHLVDSSFTHDPLQMYWNYPLFDVDHVEIYFGPAAASIGNVPGIVIIKIYTKKPSRENVSFINIEANSRGGYDVGFNGAKKINKDLSYSLMFDINYNALPKIDILNNEYSLNSLNRYGFLNLNYKHNRIDFSFLDRRQNVFMSDYLHTPQNGFLSYQDYYISFTRYFDNKSLKFHLSWDHEYRIGELYSSNFGLFIPNAINQGIIPIYLNESLIMDRFGVFLSKKFTLGKNHFIVGTQAKFPFMSVQSYNYAGFNPYGLYQRYSPSFPIKSLNRIFYTVFLQDEYNLKQNLVLIADAKFDYYHFNGVDKNNKEASERLGFSWFITHYIQWKSFLYNTYSPPDLYDSSLSINGRLESEHFRGISSEVSYSKANNKLSFLYAYMILKNPIELSLNPVEAYNANMLIVDNFFNISTKHYFTPNHSISIDYYVVKANRPNYSPNQGGFIKLFDKVRHFYIYNELIYRNGYDGFGNYIKSSYTWDGSVKYRFKNGFSVYLKASDILNSAPKVAVLDQSGNIIGLVPAYAPTVSIGMEKLF